MVAFSWLDEALRVFEDAAYVVRSAPGESATNDPSIVTGAALFVVDAINEGSAKGLVTAGRAFLMEQEEWRH